MAREKRYDINDIGFFADCGVGLSILIVYIMFSGAWSGASILSGV